MQKETTITSALKCKYPDPVVLVVTKAPEGRVNVMAVSWFTLASDDPWMFALGIDDGSFTYEIIQKTGEFVIAYPHAGMAMATRYVGTHHGHKLDKIAKTKLALQPASRVSAPLLADAIANFECRMAGLFRPGNCPLIIGEVIAAHVNTKRNLRRLFNLGKGYRLGPIR